MLNLATLLRDSAKRDPYKTALIIGDKSLNYAQLSGAADRFAGGLLSLGIRKGQHVAMMLPNVPDFTIAYFGTLQTGAAVVPLHVLLTPDEIAYHLEDSDAVALIVWEGFLEHAEAAFKRVEGCKKLIVARADRTDTSAPAGAANMNMLVADSDPVSDLPNTMPDDTAVILYTSGTTGRPKGAQLTQFNMFFNALYAQRFLLGLNPETKALATLPLFHSFGQTAVHNATLAAGGTVVLLPRFDPKTALDLMQAHKINLFAGVPTMYFALLHFPEADTYDLKLDRCISGGAAMPVEVMKAFDEKYGVSILEGYGLSETSPIASFNVLDRPKKAGSIGTPIWGVEFKLVDADDKTVTEANTPGEVCIKGHNVMSGYYNKPTANEEAFKGGWFHSGDIATRDEEGYYFIVDRKKDMIIRGGYNVYPREIEEVLYGFPDLVEAAVIGMPDEKLGEEVKAVIAFKAGHIGDADAVIAYCKEKLAAYKYPRVVQIVEELPKGPTGKILKRKLKD